MSAGSAPLGPRTTLTGYGGLAPVRRRVASQDHPVPEAQIDSRGLRHLTGCLCEEAGEPLELGGERTGT